MINTLLKRLPLLLMTLPVGVQAGFNYSTNDDGTITITGYTGTATAVVVPSSVGGRPVTALEASCFGHNAILTQVTIPSTVTDITRSAFYGCGKLTNITVDALNPTYSSLDGVLFNKTADTLISCPLGRRGGYLVPGSVNSVGAMAFYACTGLTKIAIGNSVTHIGYSAFRSCTGLASVTFGDSVTTIGAFAFAGCVGLTNVAIGESVADVGSQAFGGCRGLTRVTIPNSVTSFGSTVFLGCTGLTNITVDALNPTYSSLDGVLFNKTADTLIGFPRGRRGGYIVPDSVTNIGEYAFFDCAGLTNVTMGSRVAEIGYAAFSGCTGLTSVVLGSGVTDIGDWAFYGCTRLTSVYFEGDAPRLGEGVFDSPAFIYYLPGTTGWWSFGGAPTALWLPQLPAGDADFGVRPDGFGFSASWADGQSVVVEASTNLLNPVWLPLQTNTLSGGRYYFSDRRWTNYPGGIYRLRSP